MARKVSALNDPRMKHPFVNLKYSDLEGGLLSRRIGLVRITDGIVVSCGKLDGVCDPTRKSMEAVMSSSGGVGRSIGAVVAGIVVGVVLTTITDVVLHAMGVFPAWGQPVSDGPLVLATAYRIVFGVLGCYVAARLAPDRPMRHALIAGFIGFIVSIAGAVVTWNKGPAFGPHWYPLALIVTALPCAWAGGWLRERQLRGLAFAKE